MRTVPVDDFLPALRQIAPAAMPITLKKAIVYSAGRFCRLTGIIRVEHTIGPVVEGQVTDVFGQLGLTTFNLTGEVDVVTKGERLAVGMDFKSPSMGTIQFLRDVSSDVRIRAAIEPVTDATQLPTPLMDHWLIAICEGAASWLYVLPEFFNGDLHSYHEREFVEHTRRAKRWLLDNTSMTTRPVAPREFF
ncbi:hypothetical protein [Salinivibrio proteolyticus]|uniref:Uncharacterized protein n=1 Tax=Salinivibrio proteolyticus TaxID=334715 RepID=A0ABY7LBH7_9GAMM|nr:hypothetical protein [Salinivibrio proteolyticus]WBA13844.1 hypothetical protein N7E60_08880 [Salinivibrio proteolyticus]